MNSIKTLKNKTKAMCMYYIMMDRAWQPTPELLPGEYHGQRNLASLLGLKDSYMTEQLTHTHAHII